METARESSDRDVRATKKTPLIWALVGPNPGDNAQLIALAGSLGVPCERKQLYWDDVAQARSAVLSTGAGELGDPSFSREKSDPIEPPWPDLVIAADLLCGCTGLWIRRQSEFRTKVVKLGDPTGPGRLFDLLIAPPQFGAPPWPNVLNVPAPFPTVGAEVMDAAGRKWLPRVEHLPRPWLAILVGGPIWEYPLNPAGARHMAEEVACRLREQGGSVLVSTSPRTPDEVADALMTALPEPRYFYRWRPDDADNPYLAFLALADAFVVGGDSASMLTEACTTGKPVFIHRLRPRRVKPVTRLKRWAAESLDRHMRRRRQNGTEPVDPDVLERLYVHLLTRRLLRYPRDLGRLHRVMIERGLAAPLARGDADRPVPSGISPCDEALTQAVERVRRLIGYRAGP
jgi:mitochondrial fission protein ELM1